MKTTTTTSSTTTPAVTEKEAEVLRTLENMLNYHDEEEEGSGMITYHLLLDITNNLFSANLNARISFCGCPEIASSGIHAVYLIPATPFEGLVLLYLLTVIYDVTVTMNVYLVS